MKAILHPYQNTAKDFVKSRDNSGLFLDVGIGKTLVTLTALQELGMEGKLSGHILIIAPVRIAVNTWPAEIQKWDHTRNTPFIVLAGLTKKKREKELLKIANGETPPSIVIINRELTEKIVDYFGNKWPFQTVVIDEIQSFKNYSSKRFKAFKSVRPYMKRVIGLTGTPAPKSLMDIWAQIYALDNGERLGTTITNFRETYFHPGRRNSAGFPYEWYLQYGAETTIYEKINDIAISMKAKDHLQLPERIDNIVSTPLDKEEKRIYNKLKKDMVLPLLDGGEINASNAAVLTAKLSQLSNGAIYDDEDKTKIMEFHPHKLDLLEEIVDGSQGEPLLVFYWFKHDLTRILRRFKNAVEFDGSPEMLDAWNRGEIDILLAHPSNSSAGLNLQEGGHIVVWFSIPWSLEHYIQGVGRVMRQGQTKTVIVHHIVIEGSIDEQILKSLDVKNVGQDNLMDAVKAHIISDLE